MHKLMTAELKRSIPGPRSQENVADPLVYAHYFSCRNGWDWWVTEAWAYVTRDGETAEVALKDVRPDEKIEDIIFFGWVNGYEFEGGTFSLSEFEETNEQVAPRGRGLLFVERDLHWTPVKLSEATKKLGSRAFTPASEG